MTTRSMQDVVDVIRRLFIIRSDMYGTAVENSPLGVTTPDLTKHEPSDGSRGVCREKLTDDAIIRHLSGGSPSIGPYLIAPHTDGETTIFEVRTGVIDFDIKMVEVGPDGQRKVDRNRKDRLIPTCLELIETASEFGVVIHLELSRSGGGHLWCFPDEPVTAMTMRCALKGILRAYSNNGGRDNLAAFSPGDPETAWSRIEVFPAQDSLNGDGPGSYVGLPFFGAMQAGGIYRRFIGSDGNPFPLTHLVDMDKSGRTSWESLDKPARLAPGVSTGTAGLTAAELSWDVEHLAVHRREVKLALSGSAWLKAKWEEAADDQSRHDFNVACDLLRDGVSIAAAAVGLWDMPNGKAQRLVRAGRASRARTYAKATAIRAAADVRGKLALALPSEGARLNQIMTGVPEAGTNGDYPAFEMPAPGRDFRVHAIDPPDESWPVLDDRAYHGPLGHFAQLVTPITESDPAAIYLQALVAFGNAVGRNPHVMVGETRHGTNLYAAIVGQTATARKGDSWNLASLPFRGTDGIDPEWFVARQLPTISSGEGIIERVRDATKDDPGESDKRLLIHDSELTQILAAKGREGSTVTPLLLKAWDGLPLAVPTRRMACRSSEPHISLIAHSTQAVVKATVSEVTDIRSGLANRFLWVAATSRQAIPSPKRVPEKLRRWLIGELKEALSWGRKAGELKMDRPAKELWDETLYMALRKTVPGLDMEIINRGQPQVLRLSLILALLDRSPVIRVDHLIAAFAIVAYSRDTAHVIFAGESPVERDAKRLFEFIREAGTDGVTRTDINRKAGGGNWKSERIQPALNRLNVDGLAHPYESRTTGRPVERWYMTGQRKGAA